MTEVRDPKISYRSVEGWHDALTGEFTSVEFPHATSYDENGLAITCSVGVDGIPGWEPAFEVTDAEYAILEADSVVEDLRVVNGSIQVRAPRVTLRRCEIINGSFLNDYGSIIGNGLLLEDCTTRADPPGINVGVNATYTAAGYTCNRCAVMGNNEGWHTGASLQPLMDPDHPDGHTIRLYNCYGQITSPPDCVALGIDWHGDVIQAFDASDGGVPLIVRNCALYSLDAEGCGASAIIGIGFAQGAPVDFDGIIMSGDGFPLHLDCGGKVRNIYIEQGSYDFGPVTIGDEYWPLITVWENVYVATLDANGQPDTIIGTIPYGYPGFGPLDPPPGG